MAKVTEGQTKQRLESVERSVAERHRADQEATDRSAQQSKSEMFRLGQLKSDAALAELRRLLAEAQLQRQRALVQVAEVRLELAEIPLANTRIVAPFEGIIARVHVLSGGAIVAHVTPMIDLRDPDPVVEVNLPVAQVARLSSKTVTVLRRGSEKEYVGKIVFLAPRVDRVMQTVRARIALEVPEDADQALMPGLLVGVRFELRD
jgi:multidrug efflux pump subunit AcrA (membrane-fusion protein)